MYDPSRPKWEILDEWLQSLDSFYQAKWKAEKRFQYAENKDEDPLESMQNNDEAEEE